MLNFILGRAGTGKSAFLHKTLREKLSQNKKIIFIVPEQSSFRTERNMLQMLGNKDFNKIEVLSFSRLYDFVSKKLNLPAAVPDTETMQLILINAAIENVKDSLKLYLKNSCSAETAALMLKILKEFKSHKINFDILDKIQNLTSKDILKQKIEEIKLIINSYEDLSQKKFENSIDNLNHLEELIRNYNVFVGYEIFIDEFSSFTPQQICILEYIIKQSENIHLALCADKMPTKTDFSENNLFSSIYKTIFKVCEIAKNHGIAIANPTIMQNSSKFKNMALAMLEKNLFSYSKNQYNTQPQNIALYSATNKLDECEFVAKTIKKFIMEENYRYRDFAVLSRNLENYSNALKYVFGEYQIPYFINNPSKIYSKSTALTIFAALDSITSNYDAENVLRFIKSGLTDLSTEEISDIENYVLLWNIHGKDWLNEFTMHPEGFSKTFKEEDTLKLSTLNELRKKIIIPLQTLKQKTKNAAGEEISKAIYEMLLEINAPENLKKICSNLINKNKLAEAQQESKIWDTVMKMLGDIAGVFKNIKITPKKYSDILFSAVNSFNLSIIPQSVDTVTIDYSNLARLSSPKIVFILGAVSGEFPKDPQSSEIFTDSEINHISSLGIEITNDNKNFLIEEKFLTYIALSNPADKLFVSWPNFGTEKEDNLPSEIISEIKEIFPKVKILNQFRNKEFEDIWSEKAAFKFCAKNWKVNSGLCAALKNYFQSNENYKLKCESINNMTSKKIEFENAENAKNLFSKNITLSASQIEKYYDCAFEYFCKYVLNAKPRKRAEFGNLEYGNVMHYVLEKLLKKYPDKKLTLTKSEEIKKSISEITNNYVDNKLGGIKNKNAKFLYLVNRLKKTVYFLANHFIEEFKQSSFIVSDLELEISSNGKIKPLCFTLSDKTNVKVEGKIDRVDVMKTKTENYVRVIDYKTSNKSFKLSDLLSGMNMQMLIYLITLQKSEYKKYENIIPAGALYFTAQKPTVSAKSQNENAKTQKAIQDKLKMNGLILNDLTAIEGMEQNAEGKFIPAKIKKGMVDSKSIASIEEFKIIEKHIERLIVNMATSLKSGKIQPNPKTCGQTTSCDRCDYFSVCKYDEDNFKDTDLKISEKEVLEKMSENIRAKEGENNG